MSNDTPHSGLIHNNDGTLSTIEGGHHFRMADYYKKTVAIDYFAAEWAHHNGPHCTLCDRYWCEHCEERRGNDLYAEQCPNWQPELDLDGT